LFLSRKRVQISSDLLGLAKDPKAQKLLRSSFQLIEDNSSVSADHVIKLKQFILSKYLINLPGHGTVILRTNKAGFQAAVRSLERYIHRFQRALKKKLKTAIEANREVLTSALLPGVIENPPRRWLRLIGENPQRSQVECVLRSELTDAFGNTEDLFAEMRVRAIFKGVTYESLNDPEFMCIASRKIPFLDELHEEFDAAKAAEHEAGFKKVQ
jgi:hypothetical protein